MAGICSERMEKIIAMVPNGRRVCDVGCDHGYISIALVDRNICPLALAMDINEGPLESARENVSQFGLTDKITLRISDGLKAYTKGSADSLIIAGMGGPLICDILSEGFEHLSDFKELILSPQSKISEVRIYLSEHGYVIDDEDMLLEDGKYYVIIKAVKSDEKACLKETEYLLGPKLIEKKHPVLAEYIHKNIIKNEDILKRLKEQEKTTKNIDRIDAINLELKLLRDGEEKVIH